MKKSSKKRLQKRGIAVAGRAQNAAGAQVHADKRRAPRPLEKQRLRCQLQHETARSRGPFSASGIALRRFGCRHFFDFEQLFPARISLS